MLRTVIRLYREGFCFSSSPESLRESLKSTDIHGSSLAIEQLQHSRFRPLRLAYIPVMAAALLLTLLCCYCYYQNTGTSIPDLYEASVLSLQNGLENGDFTSIDLVKVSQQWLSFS